MIDLANTESRRRTYVRTHIHVRTRTRTRVLSSIPGHRLWLAGCQIASCAMHGMDGAAGRVPPSFQ